MLILESWKLWGAHPSHGHHNQVEMTEGSSKAGHASIYTWNTSWAARCHGAQTHSSWGWMDMQILNPHFSSPLRPQPLFQGLTLCESHAHSCVHRKREGRHKRTPACRFPHSNSRFCSAPYSFGFPWMLQTGKAGDELQAPLGTKGHHLWRPALPVTDGQVQGRPILNDKINSLSLCSSHLKIASDQKNKVSYQRLIPVQVLWKRPGSKSH